MNGVPLRVSHSFLPSILVAALLLTLAGCQRAENRLTEATIERAIQDRGTADRDGDQAASRGATMRAGESLPLPVDFPGDVYLPADYAVNSVMDLHGVSMVSLSAPGEVSSLFEAARDGMRAQGYAPATANRIVILTRYMWNLGKKWKVPGAETNPASGVELFEENNKRERYLTAEEVQRLVACVRDSDNPQLQFIVPLLLLLGCRKRELLDSQWSHFDLERRTWRIPLSKNGKARHVPLSADVLAILAQVPRWEGCPYVVPNPKTRKPYVSIFHSWDTARKQAGLSEVRVHDLRHSTASFLVNSGRSLYEVQKILGHTQLKTTQRYAHLSQATLLEAVDSLSAVSGLALTPA